MAAIRWEVCLRRVGRDQTSEPVCLTLLVRPGAADAKPADLGLSLQEARVVLGALQRAVVQGQVKSYDAYRRPCAECGRYRRIKDWRPRVFNTSLGTVKVKVPRVVACLCEPEPIDEDGEIGKYRESLCPIENLLPRRLTPEVSYLCARAGAAQPYRGAANRVGELCALGQLSHMRVRRETMRIGEHIEEEQFRVGWFEGRRKRGGPRRFGLAIDSTVVPANIFQETSKIEVIAGRVDCDGRMGRRFACAANRR